MQTTFHEDETLRIVMDGSVVHAHWYDAPREGQIRTVGRAMKALGETTRRRVALLNAVHAGTPLFSEAARKEGSLVTRDLGPTERCTAHLILVDGLAGTATRAFLSTVTLVSRTGVPTQVFRELEPAAAWLAKQLTDAGVRVTAEQIVRGHTATRRGGAS